MTKITEREIYTSMIDGSIDAETMKNFAEKKLAQLDKRNETAKVRAAKKRAETDELTEQVFALVSDEPKSRAQITAEFNAENGTELSEAKIGSRLTKLVQADRIAKAKGKTVGEDGKNHEVTLYAFSFEDAE